MEDFLKYGLVIVAVATIFIVAVVINRALNNPISQMAFQNVSGNNFVVESKLYELCQSCLSKANFNKDCFIVNLTLTTGNVTQGKYFTFDFSPPTSVIVPDNYELKIKNKDQTCVLSKIS